MPRRRPARPLEPTVYARRLAAAKLLLTRLGARTLSDVLIRVMVFDDDSPALSALVDDLAAAPLVDSSQINSLVDVAHRNTIQSILTDTLSPMQLGALHALAHGAQNITEVSVELGCSLGSATQHLRRARARLQAHSNSHAVALALGMGLFEAPLRHAAEGRFLARSILRPRRRERDVLELLARGRTQTEIAAELGVSLDTVKDWIEDLREMYGARNQHHLIALSFAVGTLRFVSGRHTGEAKAA